MQPDTLMKTELQINKIWGGIRYLLKFLLLKLKYRGLIVLLLLTFLFVYLLIPTQSALMIMDGKKNEIVFLYALKQDEGFYIQYVHSIHKTPIIEKFYVNDQQQIVLEEVIYESYGVGTPSSIEPGQSFKQEDGKYIIGNIQRTFPFFDLSIGQVIANHQLHINDQIIPLSSLASPGDWVRFQSKKVSLITLWKEGAANGR